MSAFAEAERWLFTFSDPRRGVGWNPAARGGLEANVRRTRILLDTLGASDRTMTCVLVAGTKGKGSTAAMIAALLSASGVRAGLATKPHLQTYRERIRVDGGAISEAAFAARVAALRARIGVPVPLPRDVGLPTTFELTTALAVAHFAAEGCTVAVLEVGLGGRYDATNACDPHVSVVTSISHDHTAELGTSLRAIAREKAGVMRPGRVVVIAPQPAAARATLVGEATRTGAVVREVRPLSARDADRTGLRLRGAHQRANAAAALAACTELAEHGVAFERLRVAGALAPLRWPGRFEIIAGTPPIVLDVAHNDGSALALAAALRGEFPRRRVHLVLGIMRDKDARAVLRPLLPLAARIEVTRPRGPRGLDAAELARGIRGRPVRVHEDVAHALAAARTGAGDRDVICVTGSVALVGEARDLLRLPVLERLW